MTARFEIITAILNTIIDPNGAGSDLHLKGQYDEDSGCLYIEGNLDVSQLADDITRAVRNSMAMEARTNATNLGYEGGPIAQIRYLSEVAEDIESGDL